MHANVLVFINLYLNCTLLVRKINNKKKYYSNDLIIKIKASKFGKIKPKMSFADLPVFLFKLKINLINFIIFCSILYHVFQ